MYLEGKVIQMQMAYVSFILIYIMLLAWSFELLKMNYFIHVVNSKTVLNQKNTCKYMWYMLSNQ